MNTILYCSANGAVYETRAYSRADVDQLIHDQGLQRLTSSDGQFDFWFSPANSRCQRRINRPATELLLATTSFTAKNVPLLRGAIVIAAHDFEGDLDGLSWRQLDLLAERNQTVTKRDERVLNRRELRDRRERRTAQPAEVVPVRTPAPHPAAA